MRDIGFYALVPRELLKDRAPNGVKVNMGARCLLCLLISFRGIEKLTISQTTLGHKIGVSRNMISKYLNVLEEAEYIVRINRGKGFTCETKLHLQVKDIIQRCKQNVTQETNNYIYFKNYK